MLNANMIQIRVSFITLLLISSFLVPWWWVLVLSVIGVLVFSWFFESVAFGFYTEVVYFAGWVPWLAIVMFVLVILVEIIIHNILQ